jgi:hypothetical protein
METSTIFKFGKPSMIQWAIEKPWWTVNVITRLGKQNRKPSTAEPCSPGFTNFLAPQRSLSTKICRSSLASTTGNLGAHPEILQVWPFITGWWFQPLWKLWKSMGRIIPCIVENQKCLKPPTRSVITARWGPPSSPRSVALNFSGWILWLRVDITN